MITSRNQAIALGVDLGGTNVRLALVDARGQIRGAVRRKLMADRSPATVVLAITLGLQELLGATGVGLGALAGVGVGVAGQLRGSSGVVAVGPNLGWREVPFGALLEAALGRAVCVANDLDAIAYGEVRFGAAAGHRNALVVFVGTGVGGGLVIEGELYRGASGVATEIGHVKVRADGARCGCGGRGCLEAYLGGGNLSRLLREEAAGSWGALKDQAGGDLSALHPGMVEALVQREDPRAIALWRELAGLFGTVLANAVTVLNPSALVLGGTVLEGCPTLRRWSEEILRERALAVSAEGLQIVSARLGDDAGVIGAASLALARKEPAA